ncbi:MAG: hypothetical protein JO356_08245 [Acidobacteria bacterium]|nr:hypothetical protein [Acidobacteriota bacterium]
MMLKRSFAVGLFLALTVPYAFSQGEGREKAFVCEGSVATATINDVRLQVSGLAGDRDGNRRHIVTLNTADGKNISFDLVYDPEAKKLAISRTDTDGSYMAIGSDNRVSLVSGKDNTRTTVKCASATR